MPFNPEPALKRLLQDHDLLLETIQSYFSTLPGFLNDIRNDLNCLDASSLEIHAHTLKSVIANLDGGQAYQHALMLEERARAGSLGDAQALFEGLVSSATALEIELKTYLKRRAA